MDRLQGVPQKQLLFRRGAIIKSGSTRRKYPGNKVEPRSGDSGDISGRAGRPERNSRGSIPLTRPFSSNIKYQKRSGEQRKTFNAGRTSRGRAGQRSTHSTPQFPIESNAQAEGPKLQTFDVQGTLYTVCKPIGSGGTSMVYKVIDASSNEFALKRVMFDNLRPAAVNTIRGEIEHLHQLSSESRVVKLVGFEIGEMGLNLVMELGEMDLRRLLSIDNFDLNMTSIRYWATEIFECVKAVHSHDIVHSDLKPENFLVIRSRLKIIDFGIANVVPDYTVNVHRDSKIGTVSYMAPEAVREQKTSSGKDFKIGKPADIWSCGCIIYEMVYGQTPLCQYGRQQLAALESQALHIDFPRTARKRRVPKGLLELLQGCLYREPHKRLTIQEALQGLFLTPRSVDFEFVQDLVLKSVEYGQNYNRPVTKERLASIISGVWTKIVELNDAEVEPEVSCSPDVSSMSLTPVATPISQRGFL